ncbi:MAG: hypothetical protein CBB97_23540 [Candidatus Endolissoclinum sp. TMED37]|nr:MAG: hypothetical protein CBB97_23540 [Candidatus Endolissoclinum sp. TMED37]
MYRRLAETFDKIEVPESASVLVISGSETLCSVVGLDRKNITSAEYPEFNMLDLAFDDETFDVVISD